MTTPTTTRTDDSLTRDLVHAARFYLGRPRVLLILAIAAIVLGLAFNWSWLVAAGVAPILISVLPCLIMCAVGACAMCRNGEKQSVTAASAAEAASPLGRPVVTNSVEAQTDADSPKSLPQSSDALVRAISLEPDRSEAPASCCHGSASAASGKGKDMVGS